MSQRAIVITGASTGIGAACARALAERDFLVFAGVRREQDAEVLAETSASIRPVLLDVVDGEQIAAARDAVEQEVGAAGLYGLMNNAGITVNGPLEFLELDELRRQLEVNVIGQVAVTQAFLPMLRAAKGRIVNTGSIAGFFSTPMLVPYAMSKYAMEAFSDGLRRELRPLGVSVSLLEPGSIATPIWEKGQTAAAALSEDESSDLLEVYGPLVRSIQKFAHVAERDAEPTEVVVRDVLHAFTASRPRTRYLMGGGARARKWMSRLPDRLGDRLLAKALRWG